MRPLTAAMPGRRLFLPRADALLEVHADPGVEEVHERIEDYQARAGFLDGAFEQVALRGQSQRFVAAVGRLPAEHASFVGAQGLQARTHGLPVGVLRLEEQAVDNTRTWSAVGHGPAGAEARTEVERDQRLAHAGVALEQCQFPEGQAILPKPVDGLGSDAGVGFDQRKAIVRGHGDLSRCQLAKRATSEHMYTNWRQAERSVAQEKWPPHRDARTA
jgi:hypothetical protein